jgi:MoaA/NifB/PqqE/SkfB family radical SAM enzyme
MNKPENFCDAPFTLFTMDANLSASPCPALGGSTWNFSGQKLKKIWNSETLDNFRTHMLNNGKHEVCNRCWSEESIGYESERLKINKLNRSLDNYKKGPVQLALKISNICNLRCRSCNGADSVTLSVEGKKYAEVAEWKNNFYIKETTRKEFTDEQIDEIVAWSGNLERLEIYGGEPLLDSQTFNLLGKIVDTGRANKIQINLSTNITHRISPENIEVLKKFHHVNINLSIDGWGKRFEYLRHPGKWNEVYKNIQWFKTLNDSRVINSDILPVCTVTLMNVYYIGELADNLYNHFNLKPYYILSTFPKHYSIMNIPEHIGVKVTEHLDRHQITDLTAIKNACVKPGKDKEWDKFWRWNNMVDDYRKEKFADVFPEYYKLLTS